MNMRGLLSLNEVLSVGIAVFAVLFGFGGLGLLARLAQGIIWAYDAGVIVGLLLGFVLHELAHRQMAIRNGCTARFVLWSTGLVLTLLSGILRSMGFWLVILMPGYVSIICFGWGARSSLSVSASGPVVNLVLALLGILAYMFKIYEPWFWYGFISINAWLAFFNLLPLHPLDGYKVMVEKPQLWLALFALSLILLYFLQIA